MKASTTGGAPAGALLLAALLTGSAAGASSDGHDHEHNAQEAHAEEGTRLRQGAGLIGARELFLESCAGCHGARGQGTAEAVVDFAAPEALIRLTPEAIADALHQPPHRQAAGALSEDERAALGSYVRNYLMLPAPAADTVLGRTIFARDCSVCHGDRGNAASWAQNSLDPAPADFTAHSADELSREEMIETVTFGKRDTAMMGFATQLSREEIAATVDYVREAFMSGPASESAGAAHGDHAHGAGARHEAGYPGGLVGDPEWGEAFYSANCAECHGEAGDGQGRRAYFMLTKPENFLSREARVRLDRPALFEGISVGVPGTVMPAWNKVLSPQQIASVAEYVRQAFVLADDRAEGGAPIPAHQPAGASQDLKKN